MKAIAVLALAASAQAGQFMVNQHSGNCVSVGSSKCTTVSCSSSAANKFVFKGKQLVLSNRPDLCLVVGSQSAKHVQTGSCATTTESCTWKWRGNQLVNNFNKCLTVECTGQKSGKTVCTLVQTPCVVAASSPTVFKTQCWDMSTKYEQSNFWSRPVTVVKAQAPSKSTGSKGGNNRPGNSGKASPKPTATVVQPTKSKGPGIASPTAPAKTGNYDDKKDNSNKGSNVQGGNTNKGSNVQGGNTNKGNSAQGAGINKGNVAQVGNSKQQNTGN